MYQIGDEVEVISDYGSWRGGSRFLVGKTKMLLHNNNEEQALWNYPNGPGIWARYVRLYKKHKLEDFI